MSVTTQLLVLGQVAQSGVIGGSNALHAAWSWSELAKLELREGSLSLSLGPALWIVGLVAGGIWLVWFIRHRPVTPKHYDVVKSTLKIANLGEIEIVPNHEVIRIAYQAWVELTTRKVGLPFDENHDVIVEVYSSWYELFGWLRDLTKSIPAHRLRQCEDTRKLVDTMVCVLNQGLRPHLTTWQARFRKWYEEQKSEEPNKGRSPQQIQQDFSDYPALVEDLKKVHGEIVEYAAWLRQIAEGRSASGTKD